ncbi:MAG: hypothetical protein IJ409_11080 [Lachnospiraceae bacterium]|nr:hypothetical protein [Lachnospiraceae bacterium]
MADYQTTFYGKKHICSYCGTKFDEDECPSCCSTQYEKTRERLIWEQEQQEFQQEMQAREEANKRYARQSHNRFMKIFFIFFAGIWIVVFLIFLLNFFVMSSFRTMFMFF